MATGLTFNVFGHDVSAGKTLKGVERQADSTSKKVGGSFKKVAGILGGLTAGAFFKDSFAEAEEAQKVGAQTTAVLKSTGGAAHVTAGDIGDLSSAISAKVGIDDEAIQSGENMLLTFTNVRNEVGQGNDVFNQATQTMTDMSAALGQDMSSSAVQLGKALNDPIRGITALSKVGVTFTQQQRDQIATMVKSGDTLGAQKVILSELNKEFGGSAAAQATSADKMKVAFGNLEEEVGTAVMPAITGLSNFLTADVIPALSGTVGWLKQNWSWLKYVAGTVAGLWLAWKGYSAVKSAGTAIRGAVATIRADMGALKTGLAGASGGMGKMSKASIGAGFALVGVGAVLTAISIKHQKHAAQVAADKAAVENFTEAIQADSGALGENVRAAAAKQLSDNDMFDGARRLGISQQTLTDAVLGNASALATAKAAMEANGKSSGLSAIQLDAFGLRLGVTSKQIDAAKVKAGDLAAATDKGTSSQHAATTAADQGAEALDKQKVAADGLIASIQKLSGDQINAEQAELRFKDGVAQATSQVKENGSSLSANTSKGRANREWLLDQLSALQDVARAQLDAGQKTGVVTDKLHSNETALRRAATAAGLNRDQVDSLIRKYGRLPVRKATTITANTQPAIDKLTGLEATIGRIVNDTYTVFVTAHGTVTIGTRSAKGVSGFAQGTGHSPGGTFDVGEYGRERITLPPGSQVTTHTATMSRDRMAGAAQDVNLNVTISGGLVSQADVQRGVVAALELYPGQINIGRKLRS